MKHIVFLAISVPTIFDLVHSHGATSIPPSRQWFCSSDVNIGRGIDYNGSNGPNICKAARHGMNRESMHHTIQDWSAVRQSNANGWSNTRSYLYNPRLAHVRAMGGYNSPICSAGDPVFQALDSDLWLNDQKGGEKITYLLAEQRAKKNKPSGYPFKMKTGVNQFVYAVSAPHQTAGKGYVDYYITKDNWMSEKKKNQPLTWKHLEARPFCHYIPTDFNSAMQSDEAVGQHETEEFYCRIPKSKTGQHVIYSVWQRDDSPEAFYGCSDVILSN